MNWTQANFTHRTCWFHRHVYQIPSRLSNTSSCLKFESKHLMNRTHILSFALIVEISNTWVSVSLAIQTPQTLSKILQCASNFQLSSRCLDILIKHCLSCLIYYIPNHFHYRSPRKVQSVLHTTDQDWRRTLTAVAQQHMIPTSDSKLLTIKLVRTNQLRLLKVTVKA